MNINLAQFLAALASADTTHISIKAGIATMENGDTVNLKELASEQETLTVEMGILASAFKDVVNASEANKPYTFDELAGPSFSQACDIMSKHGPENPETAMKRNTGATASAIQVSLDGGATYQPAKEGVRIIYSGMPIPGEDGTGELHLNATHEGLITDVWTTREAPLDHNIGTSSETLDDIIGRLVDDND